MIDRFQTKKIVQLPRTLFYSADAPLRKSAEIINRHADFTLMVRDHKSLEVANGAFRCAISLTPDMALMIGPTKPSHRPDLKVLGLMRDDQEGKFDDVSALARLPDPYLIVDWPAEDGERTILGRAKAKLRRGFSKKRKTPKAYRQLALRRLQVRFDPPSRGETVVTDRLHATFLVCCLANRMSCSIIPMGRSALSLRRALRGAIFLWQGESMRLLPSLLRWQRGGRRTGPGWMAVERR